MLFEDDTMIVIIAKREFYCLMDDVKLASSYT